MVLKGLQMVSGILRKARIPEAFNGNMSFEELLAVLRRQEAFQLSSLRDY